MAELFIKCNSDIIDTADNFSTLTLEIVLRDILDLCSGHGQQIKTRYIHVCISHILYALYSIIQSWSHCFQKCSLCSLYANNLLLVALVMASKMNRTTLVQCVRLCYTL